LRSFQHFCLHKKFTLSHLTSLTDVQLPNDYAYIIGNYEDRISCPVGVIVVGTKITQTKE
jgi:hypothetical protein